MQIGKLKYSAHILQLLDYIYDVSDLGGNCIKWKVNEFSLYYGYLII